MDSTRSIADGDPALAELLRDHRYLAHDAGKRLQAVVDLPTRLRSFLDDQELATAAVGLLGSHSGGVPLLIETLRTRPVLRAAAVNALSDSLAGKQQMIALLQSDEDEEVARIILGCFAENSERFLSLDNATALGAGVHRWLDQGSDELRMTAVAAFRAMDGLGEVELVRVAGSERVHVTLRRAALVLLAEMHSGRDIVGERTAPETLKVIADPAVDALVAWAHQAEKHGTDELRDPVRNALRLLATEGVTKAQDAIRNLPPEASTNQGPQ
jgi:hypothetical protein